MRMFISTTGNRLADFGTFRELRRSEGVLKSAEWGDLSCTVELMVSTIHTEITAVFLSPDDLTLYGPFVIESVGVTGEERMVTLDGRTDLALDYLMTDTPLENTIYRGFRLWLSRLLSVAPYTRWYDALGGSRETFENLLQEDIFRARGLSQLRSGLEKWGITCRPYVNSALGYNVVPLPLYPVDTLFFRGNELFPGLEIGGESPLQIVAKAVGNTTIPDNRFDATPEIDVGPVYNRPGEYANRMIKGTELIWGREDPVTFSQGLVEPPVYLRQFKTGPIALVEADILRWHLQHNSSVLRGTVRDGAYRIVRQRFDYQGNTWMLTKVDHSWDDEEGYKQDIEATLWQGYELATPSHTFTVRPEPPEPTRFDEGSGDLIPGTALDFTAAGNNEDVFFPATYWNPPPGNTDTQPAGTFTLSSDRRQIQFHNHPLAASFTNQFGVTRRMTTPWAATISSVTQGGLSPLWRVSAAAPNTLAHQQPYTFTLAV